MFKTKLGKVAIAGVVGVSLFVGGTVTQASLDVQGLVSSWFDNQKGSIQQEFESVADQKQATKTTAIEDALENAEQQLNSTKQTVQSNFEYNLQEQLDSKTAEVIQEIEGQTALTEQEIQDIRTQVYSQALNEFDTQIESLLTPDTSGE
ncbi:FlaG family protein [Lentibacillus cibarius]|uniref:Uncharacterized protein n=1 Tax=Lentibacillus cibarius TaxID=2583219 RepID=A0A5S3QMG4_9BACI|nr:hypothetical protein [Lentibacillus cibarius]TMN23152.1 hypothetical protein FFL34_14440 [Lentibacillus cibarius]